jgi:hypothetical protein
MTGYPTKSTTIKPEALAILKDRWSDISPDAGTELCVCSWCGEMIGRAEDDPVWEDHIEWCIGCEICDKGIRLFEPAGVKTRELRFHTKCFQEIIEPST